MYCYNWLQFFPLPLLANDGHFLLTGACDNTAKEMGVDMSPDGQLIGVSPIEREWHSMVPSISMVIPNCHPIQIEDHKILYIEGWCFHTGVVCKLIKGHA
uniref:Uncharacterized protein n=1 Tax=Oncorhynchus tshawytscha TaxID=74940 RepID=A0A8C8BZH9_ONCTS